MPQAHSVTRARFQSRPFQTDLSGFSNDGVWLTGTYVLFGYDIADQSGLSLLVGPEFLPGYQGVRKDALITDRKELRGDRDVSSRLKVIYIQPNQRMQFCERLSGDRSREALITSKSTDNGAVFLFYPRLVVVTIGSGPSKCNICLLTKIKQCVVDEGAVIVGVYTRNIYWKLLTYSLDSSNNQ